VTQAVNVALHATSGGQWIIRKAGDAIGSQVLADVLLTALATGLALKTTGAGSGKIQKGLNEGVIEEGEVGSAKVGEITTEIAELEKIPQRTAEQEVRLSQFKDLTKQYENFDAAKSSTGGTFGEVSVTNTALRPNGGGQDNVRLWFKSVESKTRDIQSVNLVAISSDASVKAFSVLQHTTANSPNNLIQKSFGNAEYLTAGVCHQTTAAGLRNVLGMNISPF